MKRALVLLSASIFVSVGLPQIWAAPGDLDTSFSGDGRLVRGYPGHNGNDDVAIQDNGKIVTISQGDNRFVFMRFLPDGSVDQGFGDNGRVFVPIGSGAQGPEVAIAPDGKIIGAGETNGPHKDLDWVAIRLKPDGELDKSLSNDGIAKLPNDGDDRVHGITPFGSGKFLLWGTSFSVSEDYYDFAIARFNANGTLDTNSDANPDSHFSQDGRVLTDFGPGGDNGVRALRRLGDGDLLAVGNQRQNDRHDLAIARYNQNGSLDEDYGEGGKTIAPFNDDTYYIFGAVIAHGHIIASAFRQDDAHTVLSRFTLDGDFVDTFGTDGRAVVDFHEGEEWSPGLAVDGDMHILVAGGYVTPTNEKLAVARLDWDGDLDPSFGQEGIARTSFPGGAPEPYIEVTNAILQPDEKLVVVATVGIAEDETTQGIARFRN